MNPGIYRIAVLVAAALLAPASYGQVCKEWKEAQRIGELQIQVNEASGVAASRKFPGRLYHVNDSGDSGKFYVTNIEGKQTTGVSVTGFKPLDAEALGLGACSAAGKSCLYIGDIGDNDRRRQTIQVALVEEMENFPASMTPQERMTLRYPDGPHDAESMAVHPNGTIFILTKEEPARLYKAEAGVATQTLAPVMTLDAGFSPSDMTISDDGTRLLVLTYLYAVEFGIDLAHPSPPRYQERIRIKPLQQQESIAFLPGSRSFIYTTERVFLPAWIMRVDCQ